MFDTFFHPKTIAVIGASEKSGKVGNDLMLNLVKNFEGEIYPINLKDKEILGKKVYASVADTPEVPELAIIVIPAKFVPDALIQCGDKGCKNIVIISAGFKEVGGEGIELEKELTEVKNKFGMRIVGPNCLGFITTSPAVNASFARSFPKKGKIAFFSQSGALGTAVLDMAQAQQLGLSYFVSMGNKMDVDEIDLLEYFAGDKKTKCILAYLENITNGSKFIQVAQNITKKKPVIVLKSGKTEKGSKAVSSHTGSLAGSAQAYSAAFKQSGVIEADDILDFFDYAKGFALQPVPKGSRIAIVTNAGGPGILVTDLLPKHGLELADLSEETKKYLRENLPQSASSHNPVDVLGDADPQRYKIAMETVIKDENVDVVICLLTPQKSTDVKGTAEVVGKISKENKKTVIACFMGEQEIRKSYPIFRKYSLPQFAFPLQAVKVLSQMNEWRKLKETKIKNSCLNQFEEKKELISASKKMLAVSSVTEKEARDVLDTFKFPLHKAKTVKDTDEAVEYASTINYPLAVKVVSSQVVHKSDAGGVVLGIKDAQELESAIEKIKSNISANVQGAVIDGYLVGEMISGIEVIVGMKKDPQFGPLIMLGMGGIYTEVFKDITFRVAPFAKSDALSMIEELKIYPLLKGARGGKRADIEALADLLIKFSDFSLLFPEIKEIDFNPVMVREEGKGCVIVDTRFMM